MTVYFQAERVINAFNRWTKTRAAMPSEELMDALCALEEEYKATGPIVLSFQCDTHGEYLIKVQCPECEHRRLRRVCDRCGHYIVLGTHDDKCDPGTVLYTIQQWREWAVSLAHLNPKFVDAFAAHPEQTTATFQDAGGPWAVMKTAQQWLDEFTELTGRFHTLPGWKDE